MNDNFKLWAYVFILGLVLYTLDPGIIIVYLIILLITNHYSKSFNNCILVYILGIQFLYPNIADSLNVFFNGKQTLLALTSIFTFINFSLWKSYKVILGKTFNRLIKSWIFWGSFTYLILLTAYFSNQIFGNNLMEFFGYPPPKTSYIKVFIYAIPSALIVYIPVVSIRHPRSFLVLWKIFMVLMAINVVYSIMNYTLGFEIIKSSYSEAFSSFPRAYSFSMFDPISFGRTISYPLILLFIVLIKGIRIQNKLSYYILFGMTLFVILITWSRTVWISLTIAITILILFFTKKVKVYYYIPMLLLISVILYFSNPLKTIESDNRLSHTEGSWKGRTYKHMIAYNFIEKNPLFGAFPGQMIALSKTTGNEAHASAHSLYFQIGVDYGIPGLLIIIFTLLYSINVGVRLLKRFKDILNTPQYVYTKTFITASVCFTILLGISGFAESISPVNIFLNLGILLAAKKILLMREFNRSVLTPTTVDTSDLDELN